MPMTMVAVGGILCPHCYPERGEDAGLNDGLSTVWCPRKAGFWRTGAESSLHDRGPPSLTPQPPAYLYFYQQQQGKLWVWFVWEKLLALYETLPSRLLKLKMVYQLERLDTSSAAWLPTQGLVYSMSIPNPGPRQVYLYNHNQGRPHWTQGGPFFYDRRLSQQVALGGPFNNHPQFAQPPPPPPPAPWFRGPIVAGPPSPRRYQNFRVNITWNAPYHNNVNIHFGGGRQVNNSHRSHNNMRPNNNNVVGVGGGGGGGRGGGGGGGPGGERSFSGDAEEDSDICFICGDFLQNSNEHGVHFCDGGRHCPGKGGANDGSSNSNDNNNLDSKLDSILQNFKGSLKNDYQAVSEALEKYFTERVTEISTIHRQLLSDRQALSTLRKDLDRRSEELQLWDKELVSGQKKLTEEREKLDVDTQKEKEEIARQWQQLRDEIARMEELHSIQKGRIRLDVGGHIYTTSMLTLTRDADSMLAAMFSGRHAVCKEEDGTVFIDRDGTHFRYILNYLRDGGVTVDALPRNKQILRELRNEATYFQLHGLVQQIEKLL